MNISQKHGGSLHVEVTTSSSVLCTVMKIEWTAFLNQQHHKSDVIRCKSWKDTISTE